MLKQAMHLLRSQAISTEVIDETEHRIVGRVTDLLLDADRGKIAALLVRLPLSPTPLALQPQDILSWGTRIHIRDADVLSPLEDIVRLAPLLQDRRPVIGQHIETKSGLSFGHCSDVQFDTEHLEFEWIFPRRVLFKGIPLPASDILEITERAIIVKDQTPKEEKLLVEEGVKQPSLEPVMTPAPGYSVRNS